MFRIFNHNFINDIESNFTNNNIFTESELRFINKKLQWEREGYNVIENVGYEVLDEERGLKVNNE